MQNKNNMKRISQLIFLIFIIGFMQAANAQHVPHASTASLKPAAFKKQLGESKGILIDVRTPEEFNEGHIANAINMDVKASDFTDRIKNLDKTIPYFIYCGIGKRSMHAIEIMQSEKFASLYNLEGGLDAWKNEKLPVIK